MKDLLKKLSKLLPVVTAVMFGVLLYAVYLGMSQDNDQFFMVMSGRDVLNGNFHTISHMSDFPIILQQWLYAVVLAIFDKYGYMGDILFVFIQNVALCVLAAILINLRTKDTKKAILGSMIALLYCSDYMINIRPQIITIIFIVAQLIFVELYKQKKSIKYLFPIFPILLISIQFHQSLFLYHIFMLAPYYFYFENIKALPDGKLTFRKLVDCIDWKLVIFTPFFMLCDLVSPYGIDGVTYIAKTFQTSTYEYVILSELSPIKITSSLGIKLLVLVIVTAILLFARKADLHSCFYVFSLFFLALTSLRHISIMYIPLIFLICVIDFKKIDMRIVWTIFSLVCIWGVVNNANYVMDINNDYGEVVNYIEDKNAPIYNTALDLGGYLEYNGCTKVKLDSRSEAFSEEISGIPGVMEEYYAMANGYWVSGKKGALHYDLVENEDLLEIADDYRYVITRGGHYFNRVVKHDDNWELIMNDGRYLVWQNKSYN